VDVLYSFPDALVHEVAYDSLLVLKRQQIHRQVGELLENFYSEALEAQCGVLAYQFSRSDDNEKALMYLHMAARQSEEQYANATAIAYYRKILEIRRKMGDISGQAGALYSMGVKGYEMGEYENARVWLVEAVELQRQLGDPKNEAWSVMYLGMIDLKQGNYSQASQHHQHALDNARQRQDSFQEGIHLTNLARVSMRMGQYDLAFEQFRQSLALKQANNDIMGQAFALFYLALNSLYMGLTADAEQYLDQSWVMWGQVSFNERGLAYVEQGMGLLALERGQYAQAADFLRSALGRCEKLVLKAEQIENLSHLSQALLCSGDLDGAQQASAQAVELLVKQKDVEEPQQVYFNHSRVLRAAADPQAESFLQRAAAEMQEQAARIDDATLRADFLNKAHVNQGIGWAVQ
jgi:tetratricopeptide (TPR) repeat protein